MNTLPQSLDGMADDDFGHWPGVTRLGFSVSAPIAAPSAGPRPALRLVVDRGAAALAAHPYGLESRRHLASVPPRAPAQDRPRTADEKLQKPAAPATRRFEPLAFALVLLVSVASLVVALRG